MKNQGAIKLTNPAEVIADLDALAIAFPGTGMSVYDAKDSVYRNSTNQLVLRFPQGDALNFRLGLEVGQLAMEWGVQHFDSMMERTIPGGSSVYYYVRFWW